MFIGFYNYTVILTYFGLASSLVGMAEAINGNYRMAVMCLLISGVCDMFDGIVARTHKKRTRDEKRFGVQIDSLCDVVCFSVFPAVLGLCLCPANMFTVLCCVFFVLAGVIRLAFFNVQEQTREETEAGKREYYLGMPVTASALIMPVVTLITAIDKVNWAYLYPTCLLVLGLLNISRFRVRKPYMVGIVCMVLAGALVFFLAYRYGGNITCMKTLSVTGVGNV